MRENNAFKNLVNDQSAWDAGCFYWEGDTLRMDEDVTKLFLMERRNRRTQTVFVSPQPANV